MDLREIYDLLQEHLENCISSPQDKMGKLKRMRMPIPKEYGGGIVTGYGYEDTIRNLINRIRDQIKMESDRPTFKESYENWLKVKEGQLRSPSTIENYRYIARVHLLPEFGDKKMDQITPDDIQRYFNNIMALSKSVSNQSRAILRGVFDRAVRMGEIDRNIMLYAYERSRKTGEKVILQDEDLIRAIMQMENLKETGDIRDYLYFCFLCFTSLRRGEILGLKWEDVHYDTMEIHVKNNVTFPNGQNDPIVRKPKDDSVGTIYYQTELKKRIEPYRKRNGYILPYNKEETHRPMTKSMFIKMWNRIDQTIDLKGATSHSFRASYVTMMNTHCEHIDLKVLQSALRHKTPDLAIKVYTKENTDKTRIAEKEYDRWLSGQIR